MKTKLFFLLFFSLLYGNVFGQTDSINFERSQSLLIDGGIQDIVKGNIDKSATGQLGYRGENIFDKFEIRFTVVSSAKEIQSVDVSDYSSFILNPYTSQSGLDAFNVSYFRRSFNRKGGFVNYLRFLYDKEDINSQDFDNIINKYDLAKYKKWIYRFGYIIEGNVSNFTWINTNSIKRNGNIIAFNPYITYNHRVKFLDDVVDIITGVGPAVRILAGDVSNDSEYLKSIFGTNKRNYLGTQFTAQAYIGGFYARANYAIFGGDTKINGLTGGQFFLSIGLQANIGNKTNKKKSIKDILRKDLNLKLIDK